MLHFGIVSQQKPETAQVRVTLPGLDNMVTALLPVMQSSSRNDKGYRLPDVGEHVVLLMDKRAEAGVVLGTVYSSDELPPADITGVGVRAFRMIKDGAAVFLATVKRAANGALSIWAKSSVSVETGTGNVAVKAGGKLKLESAGKASFRSNGIELNDLLKEIGQFLKTHNHVSTPSGTPTVLLAPTDIPKALALTTKIDLFLENS